MRNTPDNSPTVGSIPLFRTLAAWLRVDRLPQIATVVLGIALAGELGWLTLRVSRGAAAVAPQRLAARPAALTVRSLVQAHLFGVAAVNESTAEVRAEASINFKLTGTFASEGDAEQGMAIIGTTETNAHLLPLGADLQGGWRLMRIFTDHVVLIRQGAQMKVEFAHSGATSVGPRVVALAAAGEDESGPTNPAGRFWNTQLQAHLVEGSGTVYELNPSIRFAKLYGVRRGDQVQKINGVPVDSEASLSQQLQTLDVGQVAAITVMRNGLSVPLRMLIREQ